MATNYIAHRLLSSLGICAALITIVASILVLKLIPLSQVSQYVV